MLYTILRSVGWIKRAFVAIIVSTCVVGTSSCSSAHSALTKHNTEDLGASQTVRDYEVLLVPKLQGGTSGWCLTVVMMGKGGCTVPPTSAGPIFVENCDGSASTGIEIYALVTSKVAAVSIAGGPQIPTRAETALPNGLRAVFVEIHSQANSHQISSENTCPHFVPLGISGAPIKRSSKPTLSLAATLPGRMEWQHPAQRLAGACQISVRHLPGFSAHWGSVATRIGPSRGLIGRAFLSCADTEYFSQEDTSMDAAVLLDASYPGTTPAPLPGMRPLPGHHQVFRARGSGGELVASRIREGWLVVEEGGTGLQEPLALLVHLHATVNL